MLKEMKVNGKKLLYFFLWYFFLSVKLYFVYSTDVHFQSILMLLDKIKKIIVFLKIEL